MTMEPISSQLVLAKAALQTGTAAFQLSNSVVGRLKIRRAVAQAEEAAIRRWLQEQLLALRWAGDVRLNSAALVAMGRIWEDCQLAIGRNPDGAHYWIQLRDQTISRIFRESYSI
jgi:hypothetical protein